MSDPGPISLVVRDAVPSDLAQVVRFNSALAFETESKALDFTILEAGVSQALVEPDQRLRYWVVESLGQVVGQAAISREWSDWRNGWIWWLQSVYVGAEHRRCGVFRALISHIRRTAELEKNVIGLRLYVEHANLHAQQVYRAAGFEPGGYQVYEQIWGNLINSPSGD